MGWERRRYRGNKVWIETDPSGAYVLDARGLARLRYKPEDDRTYSVRPAEIEVLAPGGPGPSAAEGPGAEPPSPPSPRRTRRAAAAPQAPEEAAEVAPEDLDIPALVGKEVHAWTDGASSGNPGPAGAGVVLLFREHKKEVSLYLGETTNNVAELTAVREALRLIRRRDLPVRVHADSTYVIGVLGGTMRAKANQDLVAEIREAMGAFPDLRFVKVDAHAGVEWNERADALAREAIRTKRSRVS